MLLALDISTSCTGYCIFDEDKLSSAKTLMTLAQFNGVVRWICHERLEVPVEAINVNTARKNVGLKIDKKDKSKTTKEKVLDWVSEDDPSIKWPTKILKSGPNVPADT